MLCTPLAVSCPPHTSEVCTINTSGFDSGRDRTIWASHQQVTCIRQILFAFEWLNDRMASGVGCNITPHLLFSK